MISSALASQILIAVKTSAGSGASTTSSPATAAADKKIQDEKDALAKLKALPAQAKATSSGLAKAKLDALKQRLKMLMMMGGDPKTIAREAAQIAKEIGQAAKEYADAAGGSDGGASAEATSDAASAQQDGGGAPSAGDPAQAPNTVDATPQASATKADGSTSDGKDAASPNDPQASGKSADTKAGTTSAPKGPDPTIEEAKALAAQAKALLKAALQRLKTEHRDNPDGKLEQDKVEQADKDINDAAKTLAADSAPSGYTADGAAAAAPADAAPAAISVKA